MKRCSTHDRQTGASDGCLMCLEIYVEHFQFLVPCYILGRKQPILTLLRKRPVCWQPLCRKGATFQNSKGTVWPPSRPVWWSSAQPFLYYFFVMHMLLPLVITLWCTRAWNAVSSVVLFVNTFLVVTGHLQRLMLVDMLLCEVGVFLKHWNSCCQMTLMTDDSCSHSHRS